MLPVSELVLADPDALRLELVGGLAARMLARAYHPAKVVTTGDLDAAVADAAIVPLPAAGRRPGGPPGGRDAAAGVRLRRAGDHRRGRPRQALRTVPVVLDIAGRVAARSPNAWIVDFTNPVGIVTRALLDAGHRAVGLCNVAIGFQRRAAALLDVPPGRVSLGHAGLNHLTWVRSVRLDGQEVPPDLLDRHAGDLAAISGLPATFLRTLGAVPSYYLRYFYDHDLVVEEQRGAPSRAEEVAALERDLLTMYADPALDTKPARLAERGGAFYSEAAVQLAASLLSGRGDAQVVNVRNHGTLPFLDDRAVIEVPARITASGAVPLPVPPFKPLFAY